MKEFSFLLTTLGHLLEPESGFEQKVLSFCNVYNL